MIKVEYLYEISPIELIGYAKNYIVDVQEQHIELPHEVENKLLTAYLLLDMVQEHFFNK